MVRQAANMALCVKVTIGTESYFVSDPDGLTCGVTDPLTSQDQNAPGLGNMFVGTAVGGSITRSVDSVEPSAPDIGDLGPLANCWSALPD